MTQTKGLRGLQRRFDLHYLGSSLGDTTEQRLRRLGLMAEWESQIMTALIRGQEDRMPNYVVTVPDTAQIAIYHDLYGRLILTSLTYKFAAGSPTNIDAKALADYIQDWWRGDVLIYLSQQLVQSVTIALSLDHANFYVEGTTAAQQAGGEGTDALPGNNGFRVEFATALDGRAYRGWNTIPGVPIGAVHHNDVKPTWVDPIVEAYNTMNAGVGLVGWTWVVTSTMLGGAPRAVGVTTPVTLAHAKDTTIDSSRHRLTNRRFS